MKEKENKEIVGEIIITRTITDKLTNLNFQLKNINPDEAIGLMTRITGMIMDGLNKNAQSLSDKGKNQNYFG